MGHTSSGRVGDFPRPPGTLLERVRATVQVEYPPLFARLATQAGVKRGEVSSVLIAHVLPTAVPFVTAAHEWFPCRGVVAVPYSRDAGAVEALRARGFHVAEPATLEEIPAAALALLRSSDAPCILQEVGGYMAAHAGTLHALGHVRGAVEDTEHGHRKYEAQPALGFPVVSIARSRLKAVEDSLVGDAVVYSVERILREEFRQVVQGMTVTVLGYGKIGRSCAIAARGREAVVGVHEVDPVRLLEARFHGFRTTRLPDLLANSHLVLGATGVTSLGPAELKLLKDGAILASASSKRVEFDPARLEAWRAPERDTPTAQHYRVDGKSFWILYGGQPVNFRDDAILGDALHVVYGPLFAAMCQVASGRNGPGLHELDDAYQRLVAHALLEEIL